MTVAFIVAAAVIAWQASWWPQATVAASALSLALLLLNASRWWTAGYLISAAALAIAAWRAQTG